MHDSRRRGMRKELGLLDVFCIASGAMISSGLFILPGLAFAKSGPAVILAYVLAGVFVLPSLLSKAELATAMPKAGGDYFYIDRSMGAGAGTLGGLAAWFSLSFKSAFALIGIGAIASLLVPSITLLQIKWIAAGCCLFFTGVNLLGARHAGRFQVVMVLFLLGLLLLYVFRGVPRVQADRFSPFMPFGFRSILATAGLVFVSYGGLTKVASVAEEVRHPGRNLPLGMFLSFSVILAFYALVVTVTVGTIDPDTLAHSLTPISEGAAAFMGGWGKPLMAAAALLAFVSTANAGILAASRTPLAMSRDSLLPAILARLSLRSRIPYISILTTGGFMIAVILFLDIENLVKTASTLKILLFAFVNLSVIIMRESRVRNYRPVYRSPLYPWMQIFGILGALFLLVEMGLVPLLITGLFFAGGMAWYGLYARARVKRASALIHLVQRIADREFAVHALPAELKEILRERDEIVEDRFDREVEAAEILDIERALTSNDFFRLVAERLARKLGFDAEKLYGKFIERESQSTTAIAPGLAIPHIVLEGEGRFEVLLARCREGIAFSEAGPPVHAVFVLAGTMDERKYHLRALMAIAQIARAPDFDKRWMAAQSEEGLRDLMHLGKRKRHPTAE